MNPSTTNHNRNKIYGQNRSARQDKKRKIQISVFPLVANTERKRVQPSGKLVSWLHQIQHVLLDGVSIPQHLNSAKQQNTYVCTITVGASRLAEQRVQTVREKKNSKTEFCRYMPAREHFRCVVFVEKHKMRSCKGKDQMHRVRQRMHFNAELVP